MAGVALLVFGIVSSGLLMAVGIRRAVQGRYRDRTGVELRGRAAVRAGVLVAFIGACELAVTTLLWAVTR